MSECTCVYVDEYSAPDMYRSMMRVARKSHLCCECGKTINPKETYEYVSGMWEGEFDNHKTCLVCVEIRNIFFCDGWLFESLYEFLTEHIYSVDGEIS